MLEQTPEPESLESLCFRSHDGARVANLGNYSSPILAICVSVRVCVCDALLERVSSTVYSCLPPSRTQCDDALPPTSAKRAEVFLNNSEQMKMKL